MLRTLINVGDIEGRWERFPTDEIYAVADYPLAERLLRDGESYVISRGDAGLSDADAALLEEMEVGSYIGVPVIFDGRAWGKLEVFAGPGAEAFTRRHVPFLEAIAGQVGAAIGRAELFSRVNALAYSDPLTGLANRRALDERLEAAVDRGGPLAIVFCDLDGLKIINDSQGHEAGDAAIRGVADALANAATGVPGAYVCRVGGDEFCVVLDGHDAAAARRLVERATASLNGLSVSSGVAELRPGARRADLFRSADAAQYEAKRAGPGRIVIAGQEPAPANTPGRRTRDRTGNVHVLAARVLAAALADAPEADRLARIAQLLDG